MVRHRHFSAEDDFDWTTSDQPRMGQTAWKISTTTCQMISRFWHIWPPMRIFIDLLSRTLMLKNDEMSQATVERDILIWKTRSWCSFTSGGYKWLPYPYTCRWSLKTSIYWIFSSRIQLSSERTHLESISFSVANRGETKWNSSSPLRTDAAQEFRSS